ncbi:MAG: hypothetical protein S4CHLAM7_15600 [Chlamydiae bacterium]|nr:hypothetical protein [Chlamydiota bacterium]
MIAVFLVLLLFGLGKQNKALDTATFELIIPDTNGRKYQMTSNKPLILRIDLQGVIGEKGGISLPQVRSILTESRSGPLRGDKIKAILVYMNSPGGGGISSESIYYAIKDYALQYQIPIYTYVEGLCASGGYMIACGTDKIYASSASMIGSIGAYMMFFNVTGSMEKVGVQNWTLARGTGKTAMSPFQPWNETSDQSYIPLLDASYQQFLSIVTNERPKVTKDQLMNEYGAAVFMADKAEQIGLIDGSGYQLNEATQALAQAANLEEGSYQVISMQPKAHFSDFLKIQNLTTLSPLKLFEKIFLPNQESGSIEPMYLHNAPIAQ